MRFYHDIDDWGDILRWMKDKGLCLGLDFEAGSELKDGNLNYWVDVFDKKIFNIATLRWGK